MDHGFVDMAFLSLFDDVPCWLMPSYNRFISHYFLWLSIVSHILHAQNEKKKKRILFVLCSISYLLLVVGLSHTDTQTHQTNRWTCDLPSLFRMHRWAHYVRFTGSRTKITMSFLAVVVDFFAFSFVHESTLLIAHACRFCRAIAK